MKFVIDIDGVIGQKEKIDKFNPEHLLSLPVNKEVIEKINRLYSDGHWITLYTSRKEILRDITNEWLLDNNVMFHELFMDKPTADFYIDDKILLMEDFLNENYFANR